MAIEKSESPSELLSWILHHHRERVRSYRTFVPSLNYFKMIEILEVLSVSGPCSFSKLQREVRLLRSHRAVLSYLDLMDDLALLSREKKRVGGGFAPMQSAIYITRKGEAFLNSAEGSD